MSLTSFLEDSPHVRAYLLEHFPKPEPVLARETIVDLSKTNASWIGTAFDYAVRWAFSIRYPLARREPQYWIAEAALLGMAPRSSCHVRATTAIAGARATLERSIGTGRFPDELLKHAMSLAVIDPIFRAGVGHQYVGRRVLRHEVMELRRLLRLFPFEQLTPRRCCLLNPILRAAPDVGGADIDLVIDDMILDIKTTTDGTCYREYINQLLGYYLLALEAGIDGLPRSSRIRRLGLYLSRQNHLVVWRIPQFGSAKRFDTARRWFMREVRRAR